MKKSLSPSLLFILSLLVSSLSLAHTESYRLDTDKSEIQWVGKKVTGQHNGTIKLKKGNLLLDDGKITGGDFSIDMTSIAVVDLQDPGANRKLTNHLKSDDFFSVATYPESTFVLTSVKNKTDRQIEVTGNLTIKGITHPVTIPATLEKSGDAWRAEGAVTLDRTKWNVRYGSGKFFQGLGDKLIYDDFELKLNLYAAPASVGSR
jgi:polyisoprenoid-binding protein YceI